MNILESLIYISESHDMEVAGDHLQQLISIHRLEDALSGKLIHSSQLDPHILSDPNTEASRGWYFHGNWGLEPLTFDIIETLVDELAEQLHDEILTDMQTLFDRLFVLFPHVVDYYALTGQTEIADSIQRLIHAFVSDTQRSTSELIDSADQIIQTLPAYAIPLNILTVIQDTLQQLKRYPDFL